MAVNTHSEVFANPIRNVRKNVDFLIFKEPDYDGQSGKQLHEIIGNRRSGSIYG